MPLLNSRSIEDMKNVSDKEQHKFLHNRLMELVSTADAQEGMLAFKEKRKPNFKKFPKLP